VSVILALKVIPGASRDHIAGWLDNRLKIRVSAAPERGKANKAVVRLLAKALNLPNSSVTIISGITSAKKSVKILGLSEAEVKGRLDLTRHKIVVFGNSGSGKSTLAKQLAGSKNLAHLDLDTIAWLPTNPPLRAPLDKCGQQISTFVRAHDNWVIEGCYTDLLELAGEGCTEIIFMDIPVEQCIDNARNRAWEPHKYISKEAQDNNLAMLIEWIEAYATREDVFSFLSHLGFYERFTRKKTRYITNNRDTYA
jgi:uncharacterized protein (TIGR00251 family)